jgi:hypothetical protein
MFKVILPVFFPGTMPVQHYENICHHLFFFVVPHQAGLWSGNWRGSG